MLATSGKMYTGFNVENAAYPLSTYAERTALIKSCVRRRNIFSKDGNYNTSLSLFEKKNKSHKCMVVLVFSHAEIGFKGPCGAYRQASAEFGLDAEVYLVNLKNGSKLYKLRDLLPIGFTPNDLQKPYASHDSIK